MTDEQRYQALVFRANNLRERLEAIGEWNGANGATIHDRNLHRNNMLFYSQYASAANFCQGINLCCGGKKISLSESLNWFENSCQKAEAWLIQQVEVRARN